MDLMALADALLLPDDDLALATVLKSPLFGLDEEQLFALAWNREGTLRAALARRRRRSAFARRARAARALSPMRREPIRRSHSMRALLGAERRARAHSARGSAPRPPTRSTSSSNLALDLRARRDADRCRASSPGCARRRREVKRDMDIARDEVRVMTVHGAKGLEAPIVILADTTTPPKGPASAAPARAAGAERRARHARPARLGRTARPTTSAPVAAARARARERGARRIPPAALCGDDARGRPAGRLRRRAA